MTVKPTIMANLTVGSVLGAAQWNVNTLQQARWTQEVLAGTNTDKIPGAALSWPLNTGGNTYNTSAIIQDQGHIFAQDGRTRITYNATHDGTNFKRVNAFFPCWMASWGGSASNSGSAGSWDLLRAASVDGAGVITWQTTASFDSSGKLTGKGFYESAATLLASTANQGFTHGLGATPRFVFVYFGSNLAQTYIASPSYTTAAGSTVRYDIADDATVNVRNGHPETQYVRVFAML